MRSLNVRSAEGNFRFDAPKDSEKSQTLPKTLGSNRRVIYDAPRSGHSNGQQATALSHLVDARLHKFADDLSEAYNRITSTPDERLSDNARTLAMAAVPDKGFGPQAKRAGLARLLENSIEVREQAAALAQNDPERAARVEEQALTFEARLISIIERIDSGDYVGRQEIYAATIDAQRLALGAKLLTVDTRDPLVQAQLEEIDDRAQGLFEFLQKTPERPTFQQRAAIYAELLNLDVQIDHLGEDLSGNSAASDFDEFGQKVFQNITTLPDETANARRSAFDRVNKDSSPTIGEYHDAMVQDLTTLTELAEQI